MLNIVRVGLRRPAAALHYASRCHQRHTLSASMIQRRTIHATSRTLMAAEEINDNEDEPVENEVEIAREKVQTTPEIEAIVDEILKLDVVELSHLSQALSERLGYEPIDFSKSPEENGFGMGGSGGGGAAAAVAEAPKEEKTKFEVKLTGFDAKSKIKVIKEVRAITGLGLKEAKALVEGAPKSLKKDVKQEEADELKEKLEAVGATIEIE